MAVWEKNDFKRHGHSVCVNYVCKCGANIRFTLFPVPIDTMVKCRGYLSKTPLTSRDTTDMKAGYM